jgi:glycosyltransferase involved in cell wall biosynthesis
VTIAYISDSRYLVTEGGGVWTKTSHFAGAGWKRGLDNVPGLVLVGRASVTSVADAIAAGAFEVECEAFTALPDFRGGLGLLGRLPSFFSAVNYAVRQNDRVLCRLPGASGLVAVLLGRLNRRWIGCEVVGDVRDVELGSKPSKIGSALGRVAAFLTRFAVRQADAVRYMTKATLQNSYPAARGAQVVGFSSVTLDSFWFEKQWAPHSPRVPVLLNVGTMEKSYKGQDSLIRLVSRLRQSGVDARLNLVGEGRHRGELEHLAFTLGVADLVEFKGYVRDRNVMRELMIESDLFLLPSLTEGLPRALLEAMAVGVPSVASRAGGCVELLSADFTVEVGDESSLYIKVRDMIGADWQLACQVSSYNRRVALEYSVESLLPLKEEWRAIVSGKGGASPLEV